MITGTRPRHPERASVRHIILLFQLHSLNILWQHFPLGCSRRLPHPLPEVHLLPGDGSRTLQPIFPLLVLPHL